MKYEVEQKSHGRWFKLGNDHVHSTEEAAKRDAKKMKKEFRGLDYRVVSIKVGV